MKLSYSLIYKIEKPYFRKREISEEKLNEAFFHLVVYLYNKRTSKHIFRRLVCWFPVVFRSWWIYDLEYIGQDIIQTHYKDELTEAFEKYDFSAFVYKEEKL